MGKRQRVADGQSGALSKYECEGQMNIFDFIEKPKKKATWTKQCESCGHNDGGFCKYDQHKNHDYCNQGDKWTPKNAPICEHSKHTCNKEELWKIADTLDELQCPHVCCRLCSTRLCGARCNGSEEPKEPEDDYIRENPTCFYVFGHYLDSATGWHKVPDELPTFTEWTLIDVVLFGKQTSTAWMEHGKWEAKDWTFRSVDERRNTETTEVLAWCIADKEEN